MHELSLSSAILEAALRHAEGRPVRSVQMRIGAMRQVVPESLDFYFGIVTRGTLAEGAKLEVDYLPARLRCAGCSREWEPELPIFRCPGCGEAEVETLSGTEFEIEYITVEDGEEAETPCIAPR
ncbi:MAG: hydrogenase maturation nickel metallochaperone HypA [Solirubrobacterales bacterium]